MDLVLANQQVSKAQDKKLLENYIEHFKKPSSRPDELYNHKLQEINCEQMHFVKYGDIGQEGYNE